MSVASLYEYYATQSVRPTYADFGDDAELSKYAELRKNVFYRLMLPPAVFGGKRLLEFGPDTGENSLVFAQWGARLTLVEPNAEAHSYIRRYFSKFGLDARLDDVVAASFLDFTAPHKFDVIDAEGFIYTIQPNSAWIRKTGECLERDGFLIISYMELYGGFIELLLKAIYHQAMRDQAYGAGIETAKQLFLPKWNSIQHTRIIDSWFMDVIENPFVRRKYFIDPVELLKDMHAGGFRLYSSWPNYKDVLAMHWIKAAYYEEDDVRSSISFVEQSRLSHFLGNKCFLPMQSRDLTDNIRMLVEITDGLIDDGSKTACAKAGEYVEKILNGMNSIMPVASRYDLASANSILSMIRKIFELMGKDSADDLINFCRTDGVFISTWGMPSHHAVFQYTGSLSWTNNQRNLIGQQTGSESRVPPEQH